MQALGVSRNWKRIFWPAFFFLGFIAIPFTAFFLYVAVDVGNIKYTLMTIAMLLLLWFFVLRHLHTVYTFPLIQFDENFIVICDPTSRRKVYNIDKITKKKKIMKSVYFVHNGWPVLVNLHTLTEKERNVFWDSLVNAE